MRAALVPGPALLVLLAAAAAAQQPQAAVVPAAITVGDVFHVAIRVELPPGASVHAPDALPLPPDLEPAARRELRIDTAGGVRRATLVYPLAAWRPGSYELEPVTIAVVSDGAESTHTVQIPAFDVRSVLPADTAGLDPRAAKDVFGANRLWWPILLALLAALVIGALLYRWWRRRQPAPEPAVITPAILPRAAALARLDELRSAGLLERGEVRLFYERLTETLRHYAATLDGAWGVDLTTTELAARGRPGRAPDIRELVRILDTADLVKFARAQAAQQTALRDLAVARAWVEAAEPETTEAGTDDRRAA
jgi:hypothetical protein